MKKTKLKRLPRYASDGDAERFVEKADLSEYDLSGFRPLSEMVAERGAGRPPLGDRKREHVSLRLDPDVLSAFKSTGKGWQGRINDTLRGALAAATVARPVAFANSATKAAARQAAKAAPKPATKAAAKPATKAAEKATARPRARSAAKTGGRTRG